MPKYRVETCPLKQSSNLEAEWLALQQQADCSYCQSWGWIEAWLSEVALSLHPQVIKVYRDDDLVGLGIFVHKALKRRRIFHADALYLNEYPFADSDMVIEYNGLLATEGHEREVYRETVQHLFAHHRESDEFCFGALAEKDAAAILEVARAQGINIIINETSVTRAVDLEAFSPGTSAYLASLSRNRRGQIKRAMKLYDEDGSLQLEEASNIDQALYFFEGLKNLHTDYWQSKNKAGSFANVCWKAFHEHLIRRRFEHGEVQLLKVSNRSGVIGYLYNLVLNKHVYVVQTGFAQTTDKRLMPGYVAHVLAIAHNRSRRMRIYDLMHGDAHYKQMLCDQKRTLTWLSLQRRKPGFAIENFILKIVRWLRSYRR